MTVTIVPPVTVTLEAGMARALAASLGFSSFSGPDLQDRLGHVTCVHPKPERFTILTRAHSPLACLSFLNVSQSKRMTNRS